MPPNETPVELTVDENSIPLPSVAEETLFFTAQLMEGGEDDEGTCQTLDKLAKLLIEEKSGALPGEKTRPLHEFIDPVSFEMLLGYLDMRQDETVRGHARFTVSSYLKASGETGTEYLSKFFKSRVTKATCDDFIVAFSIAAYIFPVVPDISTALFLSEGFVSSLGPLMKMKWKSRKVEQACVEMLDAACMSSACRGAIQIHCTEWLEEVAGGCLSSSPELHAVVESGATQRVYSENVRNLAAVILAKLQAIPSATKTGPEQRVQSAVTSMEDLSERFTKILIVAEEGNLSRQTSIEGLMVTSCRSNVKETLSSDSTFLEKLLKVLSSSPPLSTMIYGGLAILDNLTRSLPTMSAEQKRMLQLQAYTNATSSAMKIDPMEDEKHVSARGHAVFEAGAVPIMVTHCQKGSLGSLRLIISILLSLSNIKSIRGKMIQQGAIRFLLGVYHTRLPESEVLSRRQAAHSLARLLISTNPEHAFGNTTPHISSAVKPLVSLLLEDPEAQQIDRLPAFEALMALTNLASTDDFVRNAIIRGAFPSLDEFCWSGIPKIVRATTELICNLVQSDQGVSMFADGKSASAIRFRVLVALAGAEDMATRRAVGGALATMTQWDAATNWIMDKEIGLPPILDLLVDDEEDIRYRGICIVMNLLDVSSKTSDSGQRKLRKLGTHKKVIEGLKKTKGVEVIQLMKEALEKLQD